VQLSSALNLAERAGCYRQFPAAIDQSPVLSTGNFADALASLHLIPIKGNFLHLAFWLASFSTFKRRIFNLFVEMIPAQNDDR